MIVSTVALERGLNTLFNKTMSQFIASDELKALYSLVTIVDSTKSEEKYGWLGDLPGMREWLGDKDIGGLKDYGYIIKNRDWYDGVSIDRNELEDDQNNMLKPRISTLARNAAMFPMELVAQLVLLGETSKAYDGESFFANRPVNDNLLTGTGVNMDELRTDLTNARAAMKRFESDTGRLMRISLDTIVCPPEMEATFLELVTSTTSPGVAGGNVVNPFKGWIKNVIALPDLTDTGDWYGFCTAYPLKPFIYQKRKDPKTVLDETQVKRNRKLEYSVEMRGNAGYAFYQLGVKVLNA